MENHRVFWLLLLVAVLNSAQAEVTPSYFLNGGNLTLRPTVTVSITSILWKHNGYLLAEWILDNVPLTYYGDYDGRTIVDIKTGHLEIRNMDETKDSGEYTLEINNKVHGESYDAKVTTEVPKPEVWIRPLTCNHTRAEVIKSYFLNGGNLTLKPTVTVSITSILWKHNGDLLAEWILDNVPLTYYGDYDGRTTVDIKTGHLEIRNMDETKDSGEYTLEINNKVHGESYDAKVTTEVPKPEVWIRPLTWDHTRAEVIKSYFLNGGNLTLKPTVTVSITSILWKHNGDLLAEWILDNVPLTYYGDYDGRTIVDIKTGHLEIRNMDETKDSGEYTLEINNKVHGESYDAVRITEVPKPEVWIRPLTCNHTRAEVIKSYFLNGGNLTLKPTVTVSITSILWKHNGDLLAEWILDNVPLTYYGDYDGRTTVDIKTGHLEIRNMDETKDSGEYTLEINNKVHGESYDAKVTTEVPKPEVSIRPLTCNHTRAEVIKSYFLNGGNLTLRPTVTSPITSILWRHNGDLLAEWILDNVPLTYYGDYDGRTTVDIKTGHLEIRNMDETKDSGEYTLEINNKVHGESYDAKVTTEVPKPEVWIRPLTCNHTRAEVIKSYFLNGGNLTLKPTVTVSITSILWKHNGDLLAEWILDNVPLTYYGDYDGRTTVDIKTGHLEIRNMDETKDSGEYTLEINNKVHGESYDAKVTTEVPKPEVWIRPLTWDHTRAEVIKSYFLNGGNLTLKPTVTVSITSILWKHNGYLLAEWILDNVPLTYYGDYDGRTTVDIKTGHLEIRNMDETKDSGEYTLEINNKVHGESYDAKVTTEVPKPEVSIRPLTCTLSCDGKTAEAEPITYTWKMDDKVWDGEVGETVEIFKTQTKHVKTFSCSLKNPVSEKESKPKENPFFDE